MGNSKTKADLRAEVKEALRALSDLGEHYVLLYRDEDGVDIHSNVSCHACIAETLLNTAEALAEKVIASGGGMHHSGEVH